MGRFVKYYGYVYITTNLINGKQYVGQHHWEKYPEPDPSYFGSGSIIKKALKKYGSENFSCRILQWCYSKWDLDTREKAWILMYTPIYNITAGGGGSIGCYGEKNGFFGKHHSIETKNKISSIHKGKKLSKIHREKIGNSGKGKHLGPLDEERKKKISKTLTGKPNLHDRKLTEEQVLEIFSLKGKLTQNQLAEKYRVKPSTINNIHNGYKWNWLTHHH